MVSNTEDRRRHQRHPIKNSILVNDEGVFQLVNVSNGGFSFTCPSTANISDEMVADILTPSGDLKELFAEKRWAQINKENDSHPAPLLTVGVKFGELTKDQTNHLDRLINSISNLPSENELNNQRVL